VDSGIVFDETAKKELFNELKKDYISGVTFSGGDPLHKNNLDELLSLIIKIKEKFPSKNIWLYTGFTWEEIFESAYKTRQQIVSKCDVLVDGRYIDELQDISAHWVGSTNQRVIDVQKSLKENKIVLYK
jgi:anaerobic ribonucleoside-triphosphate reductase activating protein